MRDRVHIYEDLAKADPATYGPEVDRAIDDLLDMLGLQPGSPPAGYVKDDPDCRAEILFLGNVELRPFAEQDDFPYYPHASAELTVNI